MFDVNAIEKEAAAELAEERAREAKAKIKAKLRQIADAERVAENLREEYKILLRDIGT